MAEFTAAMEYWRFNFDIFDFPDLDLAYEPLIEMVKKVEQVVEKNRLTDLVSFSPYELTFGFDHPDHNVTGEVTRLVSTAMAGHRGLRLWTSSGKPDLVKERVDYARRFYSSQEFPKEVLENIGENYLVIR